MIAIYPRDRHVPARHASAAFRVLACIPDISDDQSRLPENTLLTSHIPSQMTHRGNTQPSSPLKCYRAENAIEPLIECPTWRNQIASLYDDETPSSAANRVIGERGIGAVRKRWRTAPGILCVLMHDSSACMR